MTGNTLVRTAIGLAAMTLASIAVAQGPTSRRPPGAVEVGGAAGMGGSSGQLRNVPVDVYRNSLVPISRPRPRINVREWLGLSDKKEGSNKNNGSMQRGRNPMQSKNSQAKR